LMNLGDNPLGDCRLQGGIVKGGKDSSPILIPYRDEETPELAGLETGRGKKTVETQGVILVPQSRDENGTRKDEKRESELPGLESGTSKYGIREGQ